MGVLSDLLATSAGDSVRPRLPKPDWPLRLLADPLPTSMDEAHERHAYLVRSSRLTSPELLEKALGPLTLICIIFVQVLPAVDMTPLQVAIGVVAVVVANTFVSLWFARRGGFSIESMTVSFGLRLALNVLFVYLATVIVHGDSSFDFWYGVFFAYLITLIIWLYDYYRPVYDARHEESELKIRSIGGFVERVRTRQP